MNNDALAFLILCLAAWRMTSLLVVEDGPYDMFSRIRKAVGVYYDEYSTPQGKNVVSRALICIWCFSVWVATAAAFFSPFTRNIVTYFTNVLAISAAIILIDRLIRPV